MKREFNSAQISGECSAFLTEKNWLEIENAREERQLTQSELAELVDKKREYISRVENNGSNLTLKSAKMAIDVTRTL